MRTRAAARAPARVRPSASTSGPARNRTVIIGVTRERAVCRAVRVCRPPVVDATTQPHDASYVPFAGAPGTVSAPTRSQPVLSLAPCAMVSLEGRRGFCTATCVRGLGRRRRERGVRRLARRDVRPARTTRSRNGLTRRVDWLTAKFKSIFGLGRQTVAATAGRPAMPWGAT